MLVYGTKFEDVIFADEIVVKSEKVFTKLSQIKDSDDAEQILTFKYKAHNIYHAKFL